MGDEDHSMQPQSIIVVAPSEVELSSLGKASSAVGLPVVDAEPEVDRIGAGSADDEESGDDNALKEKV